MKKQVDIRELDGGRIGVAIGLQTVIFNPHNPLGSTTSYKNLLLAVWICGARGMRLTRKIPLRCGAISEKCIEVYQ